MEKISFTLLYDGHKKVIETRSNSFKNLMFLLKEHYPDDDFGNCGGMGRCGTCLLRANGLKGEALEKERNEAATLSKMGQTETNIRLSCGINVSQDINGATFRILDGSLDSSAY